MKPYCGRHFTPDELQSLRHLIEVNPGASSLSDLRFGKP